MTMLNDVVEDLRVMSQLHLLLAFLAVASYLFAQGRLLPPRARVTAAASAAVSSLLFVVIAPQWTLAVMMVAIAIAAIGMFSATAWVLSASLGLLRSRRAPLASEAAAVAIAAPADRRVAVAGPDPLHSH